MRLEDWGLHTKLGDLFVNLVNRYWRCCVRMGVTPTSSTQAPYLKLYTKYCNDYDKAAEVIEQKMKKENFKEFVEVKRDLSSPW